MSQSSNELLAFCFEPRHLSGAFSTVILACTYWALRKAPIILVWPAIQYINIRNDYWKHIWSILLFLFSKVYEDDMFFDQHEIRWIMQVNIRTISLPIPIIGYIDVLEHGHNAHVCTPWQHLVWAIGCGHDLRFMRPYILLSIFPAASQCSEIILRG